MGTTVAAGAGGLRPWKPDARGLRALEDQVAKWAGEPGSVEDDHLSTSAVADAL
ncbi:hypothetical protein IV77_GL000448 [Olsenella uli DSM 7084]|nr:hypothetical protein IV77_GL000448 [Olsenella uli DSM 7084]